MTEAERYAALRSLYLLWYGRTGDVLHLDLAEYRTTRIAEVG